MVCKLRSQAKPWTNNAGPQDNTHPSTTPPTIHLQHSGSLPTGHCTTLQYRSLMHSSRNWLGWEGKGTTDEYPSCKYQITHPHTIHSWNRCLRDIHPRKPNLYPNPNPYKQRRHSQIVSNQSSRVTSNTRMTLHHGDSSS